MKSSIINFFNIKNIIILVFYSLPIAYILGSPFVNFILFISSFIFIIINFKLGNWDWLKNNSSILFLIFWVYIVLLSFFLYRYL